MNRTRVVLAIGLGAVAFGAFLSLRAGALATDWQPLESGGGWGGTTDPGLQQTYHTLGLMTLSFGLVLLAASAWHWLAGCRSAVNGAWSRPPARSPTGRSP
jgi:hypothetical protein